MLQGARSPGHVQTTASVLREHPSAGGWLTTYATPAITAGSFGEVRLHPFLALSEPICSLIKRHQGVDPLTKFDRS